MGAEFNHSSIENAVSTYSLSGNLTISQNATLTFTNTAITVVSNYTVHIEIYGSLILINSSLSGKYENSSLYLDLVGNSSSNGGRLNLVNSSISLPGGINSTNSIIYASNSTIAPSIRGNSFDTFRFNAYNSSVLLQNSTLAGLYKTNGSKEYSAGYLNYSGAGPVTNPGYITFNRNAILSGASVINNISFNLQYSGDNPGNNSLEFTSGTNIFDYKLNSTGSVYSKRNVTVSFNVSDLGLNLSNLSKMKVYFNDSYAVGSNSTIWKLNITLNSMDIEHILGLSYFNYILSNSTLLAANSLVGVNQNPFLTGPKQMNPEKNSIILTNGSTLYFISSMISGVNGSYYPFSINTNSTVMTFREVIPEPVSSGVPVTNFTYAVHPGNLNASLNGLSNSSMERVSSLFNSSFASLDPCLTSMLSKNYILPQAYFSGTRNVSVFNFNISIDNRTQPYSPGSFPYYSESPSIVQFSVNLPDITAHIIVPTVYGNSTNTVNFSISSSLFNSGKVAWKLFYYTRSKNEIGIGNISNIAVNKTQKFSVSMRTGNLYNLSEGIISLHIDVVNYSVSGKYIIVNRTALQYYSVRSTISASYSWLNNSILSTFVHLRNSGNNTLNNASVNLNYYTNSSLVKKVNLKRNLGAGKTLNFFFNTTVPYNVDRINLTLDPSTHYLYNANASSSYSLIIKPDRQYSVFVSENGLPSSAPWTISFSGSVQKITANSTMLKMVNGSYNVTAGAVQGFEVSQKIIHFNVYGKSVSVAFSFSPYLFNIRINETGLPSDHSWSVTVHNITDKFSINTGMLQLPNGTYEMNFTSSGNYVASPIGFTVRNASMALTVHFSNKFSGIAEEIIKTIFLYRYVLGGLAAVFVLYEYIVLRRSFWICVKCGTSYPPFSKCPVCHPGKNKSVSKRQSGKK